MSRRKALIEKFRGITGERIAKLNRHLSRLEDKGQDERAITEIARDVHTLKGEAKLLGFGALSTIAHKIEELLAVAKRHGFQTSVDVVEVMFAGLDLIEGLIPLAPGEAANAPELEMFLTTADRVIFAASQTSSSIMPPASDSPAPSTPEPVVTTLNTPIETRPKPGHTLQEGQIPVVSAAPPSTHGSHPGPDTGGPSTRPPSTRNNGERGVRVPMHRLEKLADAADELMMSHAAKDLHVIALDHAEQEAQEVLRGLRALASRLTSRAKTTGNGLETSAADASSIRNRQELLVRQLQSTLRRLRETLAEESERVESIETEVRELRLVSLERLFEGYPRAIREMAREVDKRVKLQIEGSDVEIDQAVLERIEEPLVHLIRNAIDHGIELPDEREAAGKSRHASLQLSATQSGSRVTITVEDDGRGVDPKLVLQVAKERGLVAPETTALTNEQAVGMLFVPGFSTKATASELSGRGIGLDTVKSSVEAMGGVVFARSIPGRGTRFSVAVPVSLVRAPVLVVEVANHLYGLPPTHVSSVLLEEELELVEDEAIRVDGRLMRIARLDDMLHIAGGERRGGTVVVVEQGSDKLALRVDRVVTETHVVQKDLSPLVSASRIATGTAVIGQGQLVILLNVAMLIHGTVAKGMRPQRVEAPVKKALQRVLVVDDSELTRDILVNLVMRSGYEVTEAVDGADALSRLSAEQVDLVLTDLEMPVLDGFGLLEKLRQMPKYRDVPVIVCSTRGSDPDKRRAAELGADAYVVKARFNEDQLRDTLARFLAAP